MRRRDKSFIWKYCTLCFFVLFNHLYLNLINIHDPKMREFLCRRRRSIGPNRFLLNCWVWKEKFFEWRKECFFVEATILWHCFCKVEGGCCNIKVLLWNSSVALVLDNNRGPWQWLKYIGSFERIERWNTYDKPWTAIIRSQSPDLC